MSSVLPHGIRVPMLLGGAHAVAAQELLGALGFAAQTVSVDLGVASAIKLCRSVIVKGLESLVVESFTAARALGVEQQGRADEWRRPAPDPVKPLPDTHKSGTPK